MKKMFKNIAKSAKSAAINCQTSIAAFHRRAVCGNAGEGYIDTAVKVLIAVVLGALVLAGLYAVLNDTVMPTVTQRIQEMFGLRRLMHWAQALVFCGCLMGASIYDVRHRLVDDRVCVAPCWRG